MQSKRRLRMTVVASMVAILVGCGRESESPSSPSATPDGRDNVPLLAMDGFSVVTPTQSTWVDMSMFIRGSNARITYVDGLSYNAACGDAQVQGLGINVTATSGAFCEYAYTVAQEGAGSTTAKLNILATEAKSPILPPISKELIKGGEAKSFDVQDLLGSDWKSTYSLNTEAIAVQGMQGNEGSASASGNTITFTPPELSGWSRIVYTLNDSSAPESSVVGVIYVTISEAINQPPSIAQPKYTYSPMSPVLMGEPTTLDLSTLPDLKITEPDKQDWQLVSVQSFSSTVASADPNSVTNKAFTFTAPTIGEHIVSYIIADHYGGYAVGLIQIDVKAKGGIPTWTHITQDGLKFTAPLTYTQSQLEEVLTQGVWDAGVTNTVAGFKQKAATQYCASLGSLPLKQNFEMLRVANVSGSTLTGELAKWPKLKPYLVVDGTTYKGIQLPAGTVSNYDPAELYYVTCLENNDMSLTMLTGTVVANGEEAPVARVSTSNVGETFALARVGGSLSGADVNVAISTVEGKQSTLVASSTKAGDYRFSVTNDNSGDVLESGTIEFVVDAATVTPKPEVLVPTAPVNYLPDTSDEAKVKFTISDANGNVVANQPVSMALSSSVATYRTEPSDGATDANGVIHVFVKNKVKEMVTITPTVTINRVRMTGDAEQVEFVNQFPCQDGTFNCLPVVEDNEPGKLYTPTPEKVFVDTTGFTDRIYRMEDGSLGPVGFQGARMPWSKVNEWCNFLSANKHAGRTNWRMPSKDELVGVHDKYGNMFSARGWPASDFYWSATADGARYDSVGLINAYVSDYDPSRELYASCVSTLSADLVTAYFDETSGLVIDKNDAITDGAEYNQLTATLMDASGTPVPGVQITAVITETGDEPESASVTYHTQVTNEEGKAVIRVTNTEAESVFVKVTASPIQGMTVESSTKEMTFKQDPLAINSFPCPDGTFNCLPVVESNVLGKLLTPTPEKVFVDTMGFSADSYYLESGSFGPTDFQGARMTWSKVNEWCNVLSENKHAGRTNWRMPSRDELDVVHDKYGNMFSARGWPTYIVYWSATDSSSSDYYNVNLGNGNLFGSNVNYAAYVSCVSNP